MDPEALITQHAMAGNLSAIMTVFRDYPEATVPIEAFGEAICCTSPVLLALLLGRTQPTSSTVILANLTVPIHMHPFHGGVPLPHYAADRAECPAVVRLLQQSGQKFDNFRYCLGLHPLGPTPLGWEGLTPLGVVLMRPFDEVTREIAQACLAAGASLDICCATVEDAGDNFSFTPLQLACFNGEYAWAEWLLDRGSRVNLLCRGNSGTPDDDGHPINSWRALCCEGALENVMFGINEAGPQLVKLLIDRGLSIRGSLIELPIPGQARFVNVSRGRSGLRYPPLSFLAVAVCEAYTPNVTEERYIALATPLLEAGAPNLLA